MLETGTTFLSEIYKSVLLTSDTPPLVRHFRGKQGGGVSERARNFPSGGF